VGDPGLSRRYERKRRASGRLIKSGQRRGVNELPADESPGARDRAFGRIDAKKIDTAKPVKRKPKRKSKGKAIG
jgi:hypothetical protein